MGASSTSQMAECRLALSQSGCRTSKTILRTFTQSAKATTAKGRRLLMSPFQKHWPIGDGCSATLQWCRIASEVALTYIAVLDFVVSIRPRGRKPDNSCLAIIFAQVATPHAVLVLTGMIKRSADQPVL